MNKQNNYKAPFAISAILALSFLVELVQKCRMYETMLTAAPLYAHLIIPALLYLIPSLIFAIIGFQNLKSSKSEDPSDLPSCPFCNGKAELRRERMSDGNVIYTDAYVCCTACGCRTPNFTIDGYYGATTTEADAIAAWKRRVK